MERTLDWLERQPRYRERVRHRERVPGREATFADLDTDYRLGQAFARRGIDGLYEHQAAAIEAVRAGRNAVLATPTASGKSLAYTVPAFERAMTDAHGSDDESTTEGGRTLYVAPQRALINDQEETLARLAGDLGLGASVAVEQYTGQIGRDEKRAVREREPHVVLVTPDTLHYALLPWAGKLWEWFFRRLELVVVDEVHEYRGVFGSHVALVFRRLNRLCERFGSSPEIVCCSATIANPADHAGRVTGRPADSFAVVDEDASATGPTDWLFWNPPLKKSTRTDGRAGSGDADAGAEPESSEGDATATDGSGATATGTPATGDDPGTGGERRSHHVETVELFCDLLVRGHQTLVFTRTRQGAERYANWSASELRGRGEHDLAEGVTAYQAALTQKKRAAIEDGLHDGSVRGVWSTNALELGVDLGGLDAVLLDGYPGTRMATHQRAGRAGRGSAGSLVALVGGRDALDQYLMGNPEAFFDGEPEHAVVNPANDQLMPDHVLGAATESWLTPEDDRHFGPEFPSLVADLESRGKLDRRSTDAGVRWFHAGEESPQHETSLRTVDDREIQLVNRLAGEAVGSLPFADALRDAHPGAIYYHQGETYEVVECDPDARVAALEPTRATHHTRALVDKRITVEHDVDESALESRPEVDLRFAEVTLREQIDSYRRFDSLDGDGETVLLDEPLPETSLRTRALYFTIPPAIKRDIRKASGAEDGFAGAIHAVEHGMISLLPLELLCNRRDVGGLSTPRHPHTGRSTVFVYDGYPGGVGLARGGYDRVGRLLGETRRLIDGCPCASGCPSCVQSPQCGNANDPLEKDLAVSLLDRLLDV